MILIEMHGGGGGGNEPPPPNRFIVGFLNGIALTLLAAGAAFVLWAILTPF